jgi:hypothetical protein
MKISVGNNAFISTSLKMSTSFQHVRIVWRTVPRSCVTEIWVDAEKVAETKVWLFPYKGDVIIRSTILNFLDAFREVSNIHIGSTTADICECSSGCPMGYYGSDCTQCPNNTRTYKSATIDVEDCICLVGYHRARDEYTDGDDYTSDDYSCVPDEKQPFTEYNVSQSLLRGHCTEDLNFEGVCQITLWDQGCSCHDDCVYAKLGEPPCCRNKCSVCPDNNRENADISKQQPICECKWNATARRAYNVHRPSSNWDGLCSAAFCDIGEKRRDGICIPCEEGSWKEGIDPLTECTKCQNCGPGKFRQGCALASAGGCVECTECAPGMTESVPCFGANDRKCVNMSTCEGIGEYMRPNCSDGTYHAGCDPTTNEPGWCESCPVRNSTECPKGFFLNFNCTNKKPLSITPNDCVPCNRYPCEFRETFPSVSDCGEPTIEDTMKAETIQCSQRCTQATGDVWVKRQCQYFMAPQERIVFFEDETSLLNSSNLSISV